ncbi:NAD(P) transhydrogenase alpha subunit [Kitasatospora sp. GP30]|nr:NAD(P) transhydrogenase alpha subunit [Kitasatospora sp. GP30]
MSAHGSAHHHSPQRIGVVTESAPGETRVAATPSTVRGLLALGYEVVVESGAGSASGFTDEAYAEAGASIGDAWAADTVLKVNAPSTGEIARLGDGATVAGLLAPAQRPDLLEELSSRPLTALALDAVPRISRAQSMDVLSSMANIAGYRAVIEAAHVFGRFFTGQVTAAGKVPPAKVLVAGAGVAGLAAIGAASSLGAIVRATDPRPEAPTRCVRWAASTSPSTSPRRPVPTATPRPPPPTTTARPPSCTTSRPGTWTSSSPPR